MKIDADKEGKKAITELCHAALKAGLVGVPELGPITRLLNCLEAPKKKKPNGLPLKS